MALDRVIGPGVIECVMKESALAVVEATQGAQVGLYSLGDLDFILYILI